MKYKILKGTETFDKLVALHKRIRKADGAAVKLVIEIRKSLGLPTKTNDCRYAGAQSMLAGGIAAMEFAVKPEGWKVVGEPYQKFFYPKEVNKDLLKRMRALPVMKPSELNDIVGFKGGMSVGDGLSFIIHRGPGMEWKKEVILMEVPSKVKYTPPNADIVEVLESEYVKLQGER